MISKLQELLGDLKTIKEYLVKLSYDRRTPEVLNAKLEEAFLIYSNYLKICEQVQVDIDKKKLTGQSLLDVQNFYEHIRSLYKQIEDFCHKTYTSSNPPSNKNFKMGEFNLKIALSLIPSMTDDEVAINQLINSIEYYDSTLKSDAKQQFINFVLKNRLTQVAKLKLSSSYTSVQNLVTDMKKLLLPKKSATAIQNRLQTLRQGESSIDDFGQKLSKMFVDLTIAQSDGDSNAFKVLKGLNEKQAIKRFADGLRNRRVSTIIAARDYDSLKDAIQGAKDEETTSSNTSSDVFSFNHRKTTYFSRGRKDATQPRTFGNRSIIQLQEQRSWQRRLPVPEQSPRQKLSRKPRYGIPKRIATDKGTEFLSATFKEGP
ncbi:uncharacterized protein LOC134805642 [Cydia splendana]|uniref:uncharacterized protein LOC134805642 n=1 Tax=Cydia splendana TaxID=1100963 RepID=UPI00300D41C8